MSLPNELTARIADHLSNVRRNLAGLPPDERQEILQSIESHIYDALEKRSHGEPTSALLDAVIAEMDPPESYGEPDAIPHKKRNRRWLVVFPALILILLTATGIIWINGPDPTGHWASIDFVSAIEQFDPEAITWTGEFELKDLTFLQDGKTDKLFWTWKDNVLHHSGDNTNAKFYIHEISGTNYLFLEWMSGDVTKQGLPPKYYVLKRTSARREI